MTSSLGSRVDVKYYRLWVCHIVIPKFSFQNSFIYLWLCWVFALRAFFSGCGERGPPSPRGVRASRGGGRSCSGARDFPGRGSSPCLLHWRAGSSLLSHQRDRCLARLTGYTPFIVIIKWGLCSLGCTMHLCSLFILHVDVCIT